MVGMDLSLVFRRPSNVFERVTSLGGAYCHVDIADNRDGVIRVYAAYQGNAFAVYDADEGRFDPSTHTWISLGVDETSRQKIIDFMDSQVGVPYNYGAYLACPLRNAAFKIPQKSWFCSEICAVVMRDFVLDAATAKDMRSPGTLTPNALYHFICKHYSTETREVPQRKHEALW
jgi:hypothetical protein